MSFAEQVWYTIGISGGAAVGVVLASTVLYLVYTLLMHLLGPRLQAAPSVLSFTLVALFGAIAARAMMGNSPTLLGALLAIGTLLLWEALLGRLRSGMARLLRVQGPRPAVVMVRGHVIEPYLRRRHLQRADLMAMLRRAGIHRLEDAELVILENRGSLTVVRAGERIDPDLLGDITGKHLIPAALITRGSS